MTRNITIGDMSEALSQLRNKYGLYYNPSKQKIYEEAKRLKENG